VKHISPLVSRNWWEDHCHSKYWCRATFRT